MGDAVMHHGVHGGIAEDGLAGAGGRGVALVARLGIPGQLVADVRQLVHEGQRQLAAVALTVLAAFALALAGEGDAALDLLGQQTVDAVQIGGQMMAHGFPPDARGPEIAGEQGGPQAIHDLVQPVQGRHGHAAGRTMPDLVQGFGMAKTVDHGIQPLHGGGRSIVLKNAHSHLRCIFFAHCTRQTPARQRKTGTCPRPRPALTNPPAGLGSGRRPLPPAQKRPGPHSASRRA